MNQFFQILGVVTFASFILFLIFRFLYGKRWQQKIIQSFILGPRLLKSSKKLARELPVNVKKETLAEVGAFIFLRLTRIGIIGLTLAVIPIWLLINQNKLLQKQNEKIDNQNLLIESQRRSSLVLLMNNVLTDLSREIDLQRTSKINKDSLEELDSIGYVLSHPLIGRIASLSQVRWS